MNRQERRAKSRQERHESCDICHRPLIAGELRSVISGSPLTGVTGHVECIQLFIAHAVEDHAATYVGDIRLEP